MNAAEIVGLIVGCLTLVLLVVRLGRAAYRTSRRIERIHNLALELAPNGGSSIKDTVHRIEGKVDENTETLTDHETRLSRNEGKVEALAAVTPAAAAVVVPSERKEA